MSVALRLERAPKDLRPHVEAERGLQRRRARARRAEALGQLRAHLATVHAISTARWRIQSSARASCAARSNAGQLGIAIAPLGADLLVARAKEDPLPREADREELEDVVVVSIREARRPAEVRAPRRPAVDVEEERRQIALALVRGHAEVRRSRARSSRPRSSAATATVERYAAELHEQSRPLIALGLRSPARVEAALPDAR